MRATIEITPEATERAMRKMADTIRQGLGNNPKTDEEWEDERRDEDFPIVKLAFIAALHELEVN